MAAAIGVPKRAAKAALMPASITIFLSLSVRCITRANHPPRLAPNCSAAPSRPEEPPNKCVIAVDIKMSGAILPGTASSPERTTRSTIFVPEFFACPVIWYKKTIRIPPIGNPKIIHGFAIRNAVTPVITCANILAIVPIPPPMIME